MSRVCVDNMVLVWGIRGEASPGQEGNIARTKRYLKNLQEHGHSLVVPAPVMAEFLVGTPPESRQAAIEEIARRFEIIPFDARTAAIFGDLWWERNKGRALAESFRETVPDPRLTRSEIKLDFQLVACAIAAGAAWICSEDPAVRTFAGTRIPVRPVEDVPEKLELPLDDPPA